MGIKETARRANIARLKRLGWIYSARQVDQGPWEVVFMRGDERFRAEADSLADAIDLASFGVAMEMVALMEGI